MKDKNIPLYQTRTFGGKVSATFDFLTRHWRLWLRCSIYLFLLLSLLQALALNGMFGFMMTGSAVVAGDIAGDGDFGGLTGFFVSYAGYVVFMCAGGLLLSSFIYAMMRHYRGNGGSLEGVTLKDLAPQIKVNFWRGFRVGMLLVLFFFIWALLFGVTAMTVVLPIVLAVGLVAVSVPLSLSMPVCMFEDGNTAMGTLRRALRLGWHTWGGTFLLIFVMGLIGNILQGILSLPWYIMMMVKMVLTIDDNGSDVVTAPWFSFLYYILAVVQSFGTYMALSFSVTALAYQYGSVAEDMDAVSVDEDIENFETI